MRCRNVLTVMGLAALAAFAATAGCGDDGAGGSGGGGSSAGGAGGTGDCTQKDPVCTQVASECVAIADNKGKTKFGLRMAQLTITKPEVLARGPVAQLVAEGLLMNLQRCNLNGTGVFSWLLEFDTETGKLRTGGALPKEDPREGYCFAQQTLGEFEIKPTEVDAPLSAGAFSADIDSLIVPIFLTDGSDPIILPMHKTQLTDGKVSADNNCIGTYNAEGLDPYNLCFPDQDHPAFINGGKLSAYVTLDEVDRVIVPELGQSLCVVLSGDALEYGSGGDPNTCKRDENNQILLKGDWCSSTNSAATDGCSDAIALGGEFAASAVEITGTCQE